jgi:hypothetical protein
MTSWKTPLWRAQCSDCNGSPIPCADCAIWETAEENAVHDVVMVTLLIAGVAAFAVGIRNLQAKLERWDYQRHAQD